MSSTSLPLGMGWFWLKLGSFPKKGDANIDPEVVKSLLWTPENVPLIEGDPALGVDVKSLLAEESGFAVELEPGWKQSPTP